MCYLGNRLLLSCVATFDVSPICVTMHDSVFRVDRGQQKSRLNPLLSADMHDLYIGEDFLLAKECYSASLSLRLTSECLHLQ